MTGTRDVRAARRRRQAPGRPIPVRLDLRALRPGESGHDVRDGCGVAPARGRRIAAARTCAGAGSGVRDGRSLYRVAAQRISCGRVRLLPRDADGGDDVGPGRRGRRPAAAAPGRGGGRRDVRVRAPQRRGPRRVLHRGGSGGPNRWPHRVARRERARRSRDARGPRRVLPSRGAADRRAVVRPGRVRVPAPIHGLPARRPPRCSRCSRGPGSPTRSAISCREASRS